MINLWGPADSNLFSLLAVEAPPKADPADRALYLSLLQKRLTRMVRHHPNPKECLWAVGVEWGQPLIMGGNLEDSPEDIAQMMVEGPLLAGVVRGPLEMYQVEQRPEEDQDSDLDQWAESLAVSINPIRPGD